MKIFLLIVIVAQSFLIYDIKTVSDKKSESIQYWCGKYYKSIEKNFKEELKQVLEDCIATLPVDIDSHHSLSKQP